MYWSGMIVLHNNKRGNNQRVATMLAARFRCPTVAAEDNPDLAPHDPIIIVVGNTGDEELPQPMENYLCGLTVTSKNYHICELGNYFGFENYKGCKKVAISLLTVLGWRKISDVSIDSLPALDTESLEEWANVIASN